MEVSGRMTDGATGGQSTAEKGELFCQPCSSDGDMVVAMGYCQNCNEYFCVACLKFHRMQSMSRNHIILDGKNMAKSLAHEPEVESCSEICTKHTNEIVKFFCSTHDIIGCGDCMVLEHKACKVKRIQDISTNLFNGPEHTRLVVTVEKFLKNLEDIGACIQLAEEDMNATYTKALDDIKSFRKEVNIYLDKAEAEMMEELDKRKKEIGKTISELESDAISLQNEMKELEEKLKLQTNKANELFVAVKRMKERTTAIDIKIKQMFQRGQTQSYTFSPSSELRQIVFSKLPLGNLLPLTQKRSFHSKLSLGDMEPEFDREINCKTHADKYDCFIVTSALISPSQIVLADINNKCLKMVDIWRSKISTRHELCSSPNDVTVVSRNLVAVTPPDEQKLQFLSITKKNALTESHHINVNDKCRKIACQNDKLIIGYINKIDILKMNGDVVKTISSTYLSEIQGISTSPDSMVFYVSNDDGNFFVGKPTAVHKFDFDGNKLATYKVDIMSNLRGLTVTPDGTVFVCYGSVHFSIHMISPECKKIKVILRQNEHVQRPYSVSFCCQTNRLFLSNPESGLKNVLKIFQMM